MRTDEKRYYQYSLSFYQKEKDLVALTNRFKLGFSQFDKNEKSLKPKTIEHFIKFNEHSKSSQAALIREDPETYMEALFDLVMNLNRDRDLMWYVLTSIDAILTQERGVLREVVNNIRTGKYPTLISKLKGFSPLDDHRQVTVLASCRIISILLGELPREQYFNEQKIFLLDLLQIKKAQKQIISDYGLVTCFVHLNKHSELSQLFLQNGGGALILDCLSRSGNDIQLIYYTLLNTWMLSFLDESIEKFIGITKFGVIKSICQILQKVSREKITRVAFMIFKNVQSNHVCLELMMDNRLLKIIDTILKGNIKDQQLIASIKDIGAILESNIRVLSSFDKYVKQLNSELLEWSSVHNQRFWKQNAIKFEANDYQLVKKLKYLLNSKRALNAAVSCYDLGQFCRFYPRGKAVIETLQIKDIIMQKARYSEDKSVKEQALMALQKIMIQNWQAI